MCLEFYSLWGEKLLPVWGAVIEMDRHKLRATALENKPGMCFQRSLSEMLRCWTTLDHVIERQKRRRLREICSAVCAATVAEVQVEHKKERARTRVAGLGIWFGFQDHQFFLGGF